MTNIFAFLLEQHANLKQGIFFIFLTFVSKWLSDTRKHLVDWWLLNNHGRLGIQLDYVAIKHVYFDF